jgi:hypothetical protein
MPASWPLPLTFSGHRVGGISNRAAICKKHASFGLEARKRQGSHAVNFECPRYQLVSYRWEMMGSTISFEP